MGNSEYESKNNIEYNDTDTNFKHLIENSTLEPFGKSIESPDDIKSEKNVPSYMRETGAR